MFSLKPLLLLCFAVLCSVVIGCNKAPDPRANPDFNEAALENPGSVQMSPDAGVAR